MSSDALREAIRSGEVAEAGQQVVAITADDERHAFTYLDVDIAQDVVRGEAASGQAVAVSMGDIVELRRRAPDGVRTAALVAVAVAAAVLADAVANFLDIFDFE